MADDPFVNAEIDTTRPRRRAKEELRPSGGEEDPSRNAESAAALLEQGHAASEARAAARTQAANPHNVTGIRGMDMVPTEETAGFLGGEDAFRNAAIIQEEERKAPDTLRKKREDTYLFLVLCMHGHHGIYMTKEPNAGSPLEDDEWFATYKKQADKIRIAPYCQVCSKLNPDRPTALHGSIDGLGRYKPDADHIYMVAKDPRRRAIEGTVRAYRDRFESNNEWIKRKSEELVANGLEVLYG